MKRFHHDSILGYILERIERVRLKLDEFMSNLKRMKRWPRVYYVLFKTMKNVQRARALLGIRKLRKCAKELAIARSRVLNLRTAVTGYESDGTIQDKKLREFFEALRSFVIKLLTSKLFEYLEKRQLEGI